MKAGDFLFGDEPIKPFFFGVQPSKVKKLEEVAGTKNRSKAVRKAIDFFLDQNEKSPENFED
jgi:hypothetical protein